MLKSSYYLPWGLLIFACFFNPLAKASSLCIEGFKDPYYKHGKLFYLEEQARRLKQFDLEQALKYRNLPEAARQAEERGLRDLSFEIHQTLKDILENSPVKMSNFSLIPQGKTEAYLVEFTSGVKAIFKPETQYWRSKSAKDQGHLSNTKAEVAAYRLSEIFGLQAVPMTVFRSVFAARGSLQAFVRESGRPKLPLRHKPAELTRNLSDLLVFDYIIRNADRGDKNFLFMNNKVWAIDHGSSFHPNSKIGSNFLKIENLWIDSTSLAFRNNLSATTPTLIRKVLSDLIAPAVIEQVVQRHQEILKAIQGSPISRR